MNHDAQPANRATAAALGFLIASGIFAALAVGLKVAQTPAAIDAPRAAERIKNLAEIRASEEKALTTAAVIDSKHGTVRLPIETALALAAQKWQSPSSARADLNDRQARAVAPVKTESFE